MNYAGIEAGGTKFICAISDENGNIIDKASYKTTFPEETMKDVIGFFKDKDFSSIGVGCFGPIDPSISSKTYGYITSTPKVAWTNYNIIGELKKHFNVPIGFDTDVNGAALGEQKFGAGIGLDSLVYITIGTGIGAGIIVDNNLIHGLLHPEAGHILLKRHKEDPYEGKCPYHKDCFEGLASGPAINERWGINAKDISTDHFAWELEAYYIAQALVNYILIVSPKKIIIGGGVMQQEHLFPLIRKNVLDMLNGYVSKKEILEDIDNYIVYPALGQNAGIKGSFALAMKACEI
ncbi:MAG: ROK family protein [Clostridiaceae bacterium]